MGGDEMESGTAVYSVSAGADGSSSRSINQPATVEPHPFLSAISGVPPVLPEVKNRDSLSNPGNPVFICTGLQNPKDNLNLCGYPQTLSPIFSSVSPYSSPKTIRCCVPRTT